ncbi:MAG: tetratricopeptide (TPR) repeat protein [Pseudohongiellaceae bacterium]|jgi:tetratricopeptide (TPR) repeat protein
MPLLSPLRWAAVILTTTLLVTDTVEETLAQARSLRRAGRDAEAVATLEQARRTHGPQQNIDALLGTLQLDLGQVGKARALAAELQQEELSTYRAAVFVGRFAAQEDGDLDQALAAYRSAAKLHARPLQALEGLIDIFLSRGQYGKAAKRGEAILEFDKALGRNWLGDIYLAQADSIRQGGAEMLPLAANRYRLALQQRPTDLLIVRKLLEVLLMSIHLDEAAELNAAAFAAADHAAERLFWTGRIHESSKDIAAARKAYRDSYSLQPQEGTVSLHLARLALSEGQSETAKTWLTLATTAMGESPRSLVLMAEVQNGLGDPQSALTCLNRAVAKDSGNAGAHYQLARTLLRLGQRRQGAEAMETFRSLQQAARPVIDDD